MGRGKEEGETIWKISAKITEEVKELKNLGVWFEKMANKAEGRCVICDSGVGEDVAHFLVGCGDLRQIGRGCWMMWAELWGLDSSWMNFEDWTDTFRVVDKRGKVALFLGKGVECI